MLKLDFYNKTHTSLSSLLFKKLLKSAFEALVKEKTIFWHEKYRIEVSLVGGKKIRAFNKLYHHKDVETDVISLSYFKKSQSDDFVGEIFISLPYARRQAKKISQSVSEELRFLFIHGLLHIFGYDHKKPAEEERMKKLTYRILGRIGRGAGI